MLSIKNCCTSKNKPDPIGHIAQTVLRLALIQTCLYSGQSMAISVDVFDKESVKQLYENTYKAPLPLPFWTGDLSTCATGQINAEFRQDVIDRVNYYRAMTGVPATVTLSSSHAGDPQDTALMMSAANNLSHTPGNSWPCWTQNGADGAGASNLSLGTYGPQAIDGYMFDHGANNTAVGHRRWVHFSSTLTMDTGDVPATGSNASANALSVFPIDSNPNPVTRNPYIAWPNEGYVPYQLTPARWSFTLPGADTSQATVTVTYQGQATNVGIEHREGDFIVWLNDTSIPSDTQYFWPRPVNDEDIYTVSINNVLVNGVSQNFQYDVKIFDPEAIDADADSDGVPDAENFDQLNRSATNSFWQIDTTDTASQIVTPAINGQLTQVSLPISCNSGGFDLEITSVTNGIPDNVVSSTSVSAEETNIADGRRWRTFALDTIVPVTADQQYAIRINPSTTCYWSASATLYTDGGAFITINGTLFTLAENADYPFETIVLPQQLDNCPATPNADQQDTNANGIGDACEIENLTCNGNAVTVNIGNGDSPTSGADVILGTEGNDTIIAMGGNDTICALGGNDTIFAGRGFDWVDAGSGDDTIDGGIDDDTIFGRSGTDTLNGGPGDDELHGEDGNDFIKGNSGNDILNGGNGVDQLIGSSGNDTIETGSGGNAGTGLIVDGGAGNDVITGGPDDDEIRGATGNDVINGNAGNDFLYGGGGNDIVSGQDGDDLIRGNGSKDLLSGGNGMDNVDGGDDTDTIFGGADNDTLSGSTGNDLIYGGAGNDTINGGGGNDVIYGNRGDDYLFGGGSNDSLFAGSDTDHCNGQSGTDNGSSCETSMNIP